jgi:hypothetical protein
MDIFTDNGLIMTIFVLRAQPITFYAASQLVQPKYLGFTVAALFPPTGKVILVLMQPCADSCVAITAQESVLPIAEH